MFLSASEAEPLDLGSQALAWEPVKKCEVITRTSDAKKLGGETHISHPSA